MDDILDNELTRGEFEYYREFHTLEQARDFVHLLEGGNILYKLESPSDLLIDKAIVGEKMTPKAVLKILSRDFPRVNNLIEGLIESQEIPPDHYLREFSDIELFNVIEYPDEWTVEDVAISRKILAERGLDVSREHIELRKRERYRLMRQGKEEPSSRIVFYLLCVILGIALFHPLFLLAGLGMGYYYWKDKSTDPEGLKYFTFESRTRKIGKRIFIGGLFTFAAFVLYLLYLAAI